MKAVDGIIQLDNPLRSSLDLSLSNGWIYPDGPNHGSGSVPVAGPESFVRLYNSQSAPWLLTIRIRVPQSGLTGSFLCLADDRPLERFYLENCPDTKEFCTPPFLISCGGHQIRFLFEQGLERLPVESVHVSGHPVSHEYLVESFPFDLFQRYAGVREIVNLLYTPDVDRSRVSILDYGGVMGGSLGHMGSIADFLPGFQVTLADTRSCDLPHFVLLEEGSFPVLPGQFSTVICLDVLEHVPPACRKDFLRKLLETSSDWLILGCPFADPALEDAESALDLFIQNQLGYRHSFLAEHQQFGLPVLEEIQGWLEEQGVQCISLPNGYLPRWFFMQSVNFFVSSLQCDQLAEKINRYYNRYFFQFDKQTPSYRHILVADIGRSGRLNGLPWKDFVSAGIGQMPSHWASLGQVLLELLSLNRIGTLQKEAGRLSFLLASREQNLIQQQIYQNMLKEQLDLAKLLSGNLEKELQDARSHSANQEMHRNNLETHIRGLEEHVRGLEEHIRGLEVERHASEIQKEETLIRLHQLELNNLLAEQEKRETAELRRQVELLHHEIYSPTWKVVLRTVWKWIRKNFRS